MLVKNPREAVDLRAVRRIREARGMSRRELSDKTGISTQMIHFWESGQKGASVYTLMRVADALQCSVDELLGRENQGNQENQEEEIA